MHITPEDLQDLRAIADQRDEVLCWCVRMEFQHRVTDREKAIEKIQREDKRSLEEAERLVSYWVAGGAMMLELVKCHACRGQGWCWSTYEDDDCRTCSGQGRTHRFLMPPEEWVVGDPV